MSDDLPPEDTSITVDIGEWVEKARPDPALYLERQATEIFLGALAIAEPYGHRIYLKGGTLMGVVYASPRQTADIDFTTSMEPTNDFAEKLAAALDAAFPRAAAKIGYPDFLCRIQTIKHRPRPEHFIAADGPALKISIGYARRGSPQQKNWEAGHATEVLHVDISFREPVGAIQIVSIDEQGSTIRAYSLFDLIAEKFRALLQQEKRKRHRRQDVYDIDILAQKFPFDASEKTRLHALLLKKCASRDIMPNRKSLSDPEIIKRAHAEWDTLALEIGSVPDFDECFERVDALYSSLPWLE